MTQMRKKIAEHMVFSRRTSAHVNTVFAVDFTQVMKRLHRERTVSSRKRIRAHAHAVLHPGAD